MAGDWRHVVKDGDFAADFLRDAFRRFARAIFLDHDELHVLGFCPLDQASDMRGRWLNAGFRFERVELHQAEAVKKVGEVAMINDRLLSFQRSDRFLPLGHLRLEAFSEFLGVRVELAGVRGVELAKTRGEGAARDHRIFRIHQVMRIARSMNVAL